MAPLQYFVVNYVPDDFRAEILPELKRLSKKGTVRVVDMLFVTRTAKGEIEQKELKELLPDVGGILSIPRDEDSEWFTRDDVDQVGEVLPERTTVALILLEHSWVSRLDAAVSRANLALDARSDLPEPLTETIERFLIQRETIGLAASATVNGTHRYSF